MLVECCLRLTQEKHTLLQANADLDLRLKELSRLRDERQEQQEREEARIKEEQGAVSSTLQEQHRKKLEEVDDLMRYVI